MNEAYEWVAKIIGSCNNPFHFECANQLVGLFYQQFKNDEFLEKLIRLKRQKYLETVVKAIIEKNQ